MGTDKKLPELTRRGFLKRNEQMLAGSLLASAAPWVSRGRSSAPPNIVFFICDQMRADALGFLGSPNARTPQLDRLAARGVSFDNCFSNNPVCMPSRKSMFSGLYPHQHGSLTNQPSRPMELPDTLVAHFMERGYRVGYIGKNHCYRDKALSSLDTTHIRDREPFRVYNQFVPPEWHCDTYWPAEETYAWRSTGEALQFLSRANDKNPFFLTVSYFDPHPPYMAPSEFTSRYRSDQMKIPAYVPPAALSGRLDDFCRAMKFDRIKDSDLTETMRYYYASIEGMVDYQVGRIIGALEKQGLMENTIVLFVSDHGDFMGHHRAVRKGMFLYDALVHVPMIWSVPGLSGGRRTRSLVQGIDIFPTLVDLTGGKLSRDLPGRSLKTVLSGTESGGRAEIFTSAAYGELPRELVETNKLSSAPKTTPVHTLVEDGSDQPDHRMSMLRTQEWKFILNESRPPELYRMDEGVERQNVADLKEFAGVRRDLEQRLAAWWKW